MNVAPWSSAGAASSAASSAASISSLSVTSTPNLYSALFAYQHSQSPPATPPRPLTSAPQLPIVIQPQSHMPPPPQEYAVRGSVRRYTLINGTRAQDQASFSTGLSSVESLIQTIKNTIECYKRQVFTRDETFTLSSVKSAFKALSAKLHDIYTYKLPTLQKQVALRCSVQEAADSFGKLQAMTRTSYLLQEDILFLNRVAKSPLYNKALTKCRKWTSACHTIIQGASDRSVEKTTSKAEKVITKACELFHLQKQTIQTEALDLRLVARIDALHQGQIAFFQHFIHNLPQSVNTPSIQAQLSALLTPTQTVDSLASTMARLTLSDTAQTTTSAALASAASPVATVSTTSTSARLPVTKQFSQITLNNAYCYKQGSKIPRVGYYFGLGPDHTVWQIENEVSRGLQKLNADLNAFLQKQSFSTHGSEEIASYKAVCDDLENRLDQLQKSFIQKPYTEQFHDGLNFASELRMHISDIRQKILFVQKCFQAGFDTTNELFTPLAAFLSGDSETNRLKALYKLISLEEKLGIAAPLDEFFASFNNSAQHTILELICYFGRPSVALKAYDKTMIQEIISGKYPQEQDTALSDEIKNFLLRSMLRLSYFKSEFQNEFQDALFCVALYALEKKALFQSSFGSDEEFQVILQCFKKQNTYTSMGRVLELFTRAFKLVYALGEPIDQQQTEVRAILDRHCFCKLHQMLVDSNKLIQNSRGADTQIDGEIYHLKEQITTEQGQIEVAQVGVARAKAQIDALWPQKMNLEPQVFAEGQRLAQLTKQLYTLEMNPVGKSVDSHNTPSLKDTAYLLLEGEEFRVKEQQKQALSVQKQKTESTLRQVQGDGTAVQSNIEHLQNTERTIRGQIEGHENAIKRLTAQIQAKSGEKQACPTFFEQLYKQAYDAYSKNCNYTVLNGFFTQQSSTLFLFIFEALFAETNDAQESAKTQICQLFEKTQINAQTLPPVLDHLLCIFSLNQFETKGGMSLTPVEVHFLIELFDKYVSTSYFEALSQLYDHDVLELVLYQLYTHDNCLPSAACSKGTQPPIALLRAHINETRKVYLEAWKRLMDAYEQFKNTIHTDQETSVKKEQCLKLLSQASSQQATGIPQFSAIHAACVKKMQRDFDRAFAAKPA